jgi:hypothetical protein
MTAVKDQYVTDNPENSQSQMNLAIGQLMEAVRQYHQLTEECCCQPSGWQLEGNIIICQHWVLLVASWW